MIISSSSQYNLATAFVLFIFMIIGCKPNICQEKSQFLTEIENLRSKSALQKSSVEKDWASFDQDLITLFDKCFDQYRDELTDLEKEGFYSAAADIYYNRYYSDIQLINAEMATGFKNYFDLDLSDSTNALATQIKEKITATFKEDFRMKVQNFAKEARDEDQQSPENTSELE